MKNKRMILYGLIAIGIICVIVGVVLLFDFKNDDNPVVDNQEEQEENPPIDDKNDGDIYSFPDKKENKNVEMTNLKYSKNGDSYLLSMEVYNKNKIDYINLIALVSFWNEDGEFVDSMELHLGAVKSGEKKNVEIVLTDVLPPISDYKLTISKRSK